MHTYILRSTVPGVDHMFSKGYPLLCYPGITGQILSVGRRRLSDGILLIFTRSLCAASFTARLLEIEHLRALPDSSSMT